MLLPCFGLTKLEFTLRFTISAPTCLGLTKPKFTLRFTINARTCFGLNQTKIYIKIYNKCSYMSRFNQTVIREPTVCASLKLQYWRQLKYFVIELVPIL